MSIKLSPSTHRNRAFRRKGQERRWISLAGDVSTTLMCVCGNMVKDRKNKPIPAVCKLHTEDGVM